MFREGYYLEIIKTKSSAATAVITVKEKTVDIKRKRIKTNKWLTLEDWASLYEILEKALLQNSEKKPPRSTEKKKFTRHLEISYTFEASENSTDGTSPQTIKVSVSSARKEKRKKSTHGDTKSTTNSNNNNNNVNTKNEDKDKKLNSEICNADEVITLDYKSEYKVEEYIPDVLNVNKIDSSDNNDENSLNIGYTPSRKSTLELLQQQTNENNINEYVPSLLGDEERTTISNDLIDNLYIPNSITKSEYNLNETYEPSSLTISTNARTSDEYIPNSKNVKKVKVEEYQPDFIVRNKMMKFDNSYIPSSSQKIKELKRNDKKLSKIDGNKRSKVSNKEDNYRNDGSNKDVSNSSATRKNSNNNPGQIDIKREM